MVIVPTVIAATINLLRLVHIFSSRLLLSELAEKHSL
jgi:hypothetical protein